MFAQGGQTVKRDDSYLRRARHDTACYASAMKLRIKELRTERGWSVQALADAVGLSKSYVSDLENGKRRASDYRLEKFAQAFGVSIFDLIDDGSVGAEERALLMDFANMSPEHRAMLLKTAKAFRDAD